MVSDFVRQHVRLGEVARRAEPLLELTVEAQVDVDLARGRAVERPCRRPCDSASLRIDPVREEHDGGWLVPITERSGPRLD